MPTQDLIVIGGGAAGLTAATAAATAGLTTTVIDRMGGGGELMNLGPLHDHTPEETGPDLAGRLLEAAVTAGAELSVTEVTALTPTPDGWHVATDDGPLTARAIILAAGLAHGTLGLTNEQDFEGMGLSHCAACDGPLFQNQPVIVAGADRWAQQEAKDLAALSCQVTLVTQGADIPPIENVTIAPGFVIELTGANGLDSVVVKRDDGSTEQLPAQGVFVQTGRRGATGIAPEGLARDSHGRLETNESLETSAKNLFAAGDARAGSPQTIAAAIDDATRAAAAVQKALGK